MNNRISTRRRRIIRRESLKVQKKTIKRRNGRKIKDIINGE